MRNSRGDSQVAKNTIKSGLVAEDSTYYVNFRTDFPYVRLNFLRYARNDSQFYGVIYRWADLRLKIGLLYANIGLKWAYICFWQIGRTS